MDFLNNLSSYDIFNSFLPGALFCILLKYLVGYNLLVGDKLENILICYFIGIVVSRLGSFFVENLLKKMKFIVFAPYSDYVNAEQKDKKIGILSKTNNSYRSYIVACFVALIAIVVKKINTDFSIMDLKIIAIIVFLLIFLFAYRKQTDYVKKRVEKVLSE